MKGTLTLIKLILPALLTITLFSLWAGFALLVVNSYFYQDLPGYTIGKLCIWEVVALIVAALIAFIMLKKWGNLKMKIIENKPSIILHKNYGIYFSLYFLIGLIVAVWQFWRFAQNY